MQLFEKIGNGFQQLGQPHEIISGPRVAKYFHNRAAGNFMEFR